MEDKIYMIFNKKTAGFLSFLNQHRSMLWLSAFIFLMYSFLVVYRYIHFAYDDWDMAFTNQELWNLLHGRTYSSIFGFYCFGSHAEFINLVILPIFAVFQIPLTFTFVQIILFVLSGGGLIFNNIRRY